MAKVQGRERQFPESQAPHARFPAKAVSLPLGYRRVQGLTEIWPRWLGRVSGSLAFRVVLLSFAFCAQAAIGQSPALIRPAPGSVLPGASVTFTWTAVSDATSYELKLGSIPKDLGHLGTYAAKRTSATTVSVHAAGLPTNGEVLYAVLTWVIGGHSYSAEYAYIAAFRGTSSAPVIDSLSCASASFTGSGTDACTVTLNAAAGKNGLSLELASSEPHAVVPVAVKIAAGKKSAIFYAEIAAVYLKQTAILMVTDGKSFKTFPVELNAGSSVLELESRIVAFGSVDLDATSTQSLRLNSTGKNPLTVDSAKISGKGFKMSGPRLPATLDPGKDLILDLEFDPAAAGRASGTLTIVSNSVTGGSTVVALSGTGATSSYEVRLTWDAPVAPGVVIAGYRVYRAVKGSTDYGLRNAALVVDTSYTDDSVESGADYVYFVEAVDKAGFSSEPSKSLSISIP
jgi:hypothetical protein